MWYDETPERLGNGSGGTTQQLLYQTMLLKVLLYGVLSEAYSYLKNTQDMQLYTQKFQNALTGFCTMSRWDVNEEMSM